MHRPIHLIRIVQPVPNLISWPPLSRRFSVILVALAFTFALSQKARAVDPPPDGGYPNGNTAEGDGALFKLTTGTNNTAVGFNALTSNTAGNANTAGGREALASNTMGSDNTANGAFALNRNTVGGDNTANGTSALLFNTTGNKNTATGVAALQGNTASNNTASGFGALAENTSGNNNTADGFEALVNNSTGSNNTATGSQALGGGTPNAASANTATGAQTLFRNTTGNGNAATGFKALFHNTIGNSNIAEGGGALGNNSTGSFNVAVGFNAGANLTTGSNNIDIGALGVAGESNTMRIGTVKQTATFISGIRGVTTANANAVPVVIDSAGQVGTVSSSQRFKDQIKPMDNASEAIMALRPVTFHYKTDTQNTPQFGLIAEEVAKVNPDLVVRDDNGQIYTVRYEAVNAMLLNEFLKEHCEVETQNYKMREQEARLTRQEALIAQQQKQIEMLTATVQKVNDQLELNRSVATAATNY